MENAYKNIFSGNKQSVVLHSFRRDGLLRSGFTLIELLVVVLIVGILASIALPQYQRAVLSSRYAKSKALAYAYVKAAKLYQLQRGEWPASFNSLLITPPKGLKVLTPSASDCGQTGDTYCCLMQGLDGFQSAGVVCGTTNYAIALQYRRFSSHNESYDCIAKNDNEIAMDICSEEGTFSSNLNLPTPNGHKTGYKYYTLKP